MPALIAAPSHVALPEWISDETHFPSACEVKLPGEWTYKPRFCVFCTADGVLTVYESRDKALMGEAPLRRCDRH